MRQILLTALIILMVILFIHLALFNPERVVLTLPFWGRFEQVPVIVIILGSILAGVVISLIVLSLKETVKFYQKWVQEKESKAQKLLEQQYHKALVLKSHGRTSDAIEQFEDILRQSPFHFQALTVMGDIYAEERDWEQAARYHAKALEMQGQDENLGLKLEQDYRLSGRTNESLNLLRQIIRTNPENLEAYRRQRQYYVDRAEWDKALEVQRQLVAQIKANSPNGEEQTILLGIRVEAASERISRDDLEEAAKILKDVLKTDKKFLPAIIKLAEVHFRQGDKDEALDLLERSYRVIPSPVLIKKLEELSLQREEPHRAIIAYQTAMRQYPKDGRLNLGLGQFYLKLEMLDEAQEQFQYLQQQGQDCPQLYYLLAEVYQHKRQTELACHEYQRAFSALDPWPLYKCRVCAASFPKWETRCPECKSWNSLDFHTNLTL